MIRSVRDFNLENKRVFLRCDFNVPLDQQARVSDDFRIKASLPTIKYLQETRAKVVLASHLGEPNSRASKKLSLEPVRKALSRLLSANIKKTKDCIGKEVEEASRKMEPGDILLLENLRFHRGEKANNLDFAKELAKIGDIYINDAFGACHREHASVVLLPKLLPAGIGFLLEKEIKVLSSIMENPARPLAAIVGGAKISTKVKLISRLLKQADNVILGGLVANAVLEAKGLLKKQSLGLEELLKDIHSFDLTSSKLHLPLDAVVAPDEKGKSYVRECALGNVRSGELVFDIGRETIDIFTKIISEAKTVIFVGPLGFFEEPNFSRGTREIAKAISASKAVLKVAGGGDTVSALAKFDLRDNFNHISTGGGAMLEFLSGEKLPGITALES